MRKSQIMRQAWSLYRATVAEFPETRSRAQFALCLKEAHRIANTAANARREWEQMTGAQQFESLTRMAWAVRKRAEATGRGIDTEWIRTTDDAQTVAADAWPRVLSALDRNDQREDPAPPCVYPLRRLHPGSAQHQPRRNPARFRLHQRRRHHPSRAA